MGKFGLIIAHIALIVFGIYTLWDGFTGVEIGDVVIEKVTISEYIAELKTLSYEDVGFWAWFWAYCKPILLLLSSVWAIISILLIPTLWFERWTTFSWVVVGLVILGVSIALWYYIWTQDFSMPAFWAVILKIFASFVVVVPLAFAFLPYIAILGYFMVNDYEIQDISIGVFLLVFLGSVIAVMPIILLIMVALVFWWLAILIIAGIVGAGTVTYKITVERI